MNKFLDLIPDNIRAFNPKQKIYINGKARDLNIIIQDLDLMLDCSQENI